MSLKRIGIIFRKELLDTLRDRKTLIFMIALPVGLVPGLMAVMTRVMTSQIQKTKEMRLVVQAEPEERDRFCSFLRARLAPLRTETELALQFLGPSVAEPVRAIAGDLSLEPFEVLTGSAANPRVREHARYAELRGALATMQQQAMAQIRKQMSNEGGDEPGAATNQNPEALRRVQQFMDLVSPLNTIEYVSAAEARARSATHAPAPIETLPAKVRADPARTAGAVAVSERRIHAMLQVPGVLDADVARRADTVTVSDVFDSTVDLSNEAHRRIQASLATANGFAVIERLASEELPSTFVEPVRLDSFNAAPPSKEVLKVVASFLPYVLILMCFLGGLHPATDLGSGEKERLTLETLLVAPASRLEIAVGKFGVVFLSALLAGLLATASLAWTFTSGLASKEMSAMLDLKLDAKTVLLCLGLIAPLAAVFASLMLAMSIYAKSQKEAQSLMMPLQFLILVPAILSTIPTIELDTRFAWVPVMNVALGLRAILTAGGATLPWTEIVIIFVSTSLFALLALLFCARRFNQESVIFRS